MKDLQQSERYVSDDDATHEATRKDRNGRRRFSITGVIQIALLIVGMALAAIYGAARVESLVASRIAIEKFNAAYTPQANEIGDGGAATAPETKDSNDERVEADEQEAASREAEPLAILKIPSVHVEAPLFEGTDRITLNHAAGLIEGTAHPGEAGNIGIAAHRDGFFRGLKDIKQGDAVELRTHDGIDVYTVDHTQIVNPRDVSVLQPQDRPAITLVTCYPFYFIGKAPKRFVVTAYLTQHSTAEQTTTNARPYPQPFHQTLEEQ